jgi:glutathione S-transferase
MTDALPILYSFRRCPYAMRARMALWQSGIGVELREIILREKPPALVAASAKATVPVLVTPNGEVIDESLAITEWALRQNDPSAWLNAVDWALIAENDGPFKTALDRYKYPHRYDIADATPYRDAGFAWLSGLNDRLKDRAYLSAETCGLTDIAIFPFVRQYRATDANWFDGQAVAPLQNWLAALTGAPMFTAIMKKFPRWSEGNPPTLFHQDKLFRH